MMMMMIYASSQIHLQPSRDTTNISSAEISSIQNETTF